MNCRLCSAPLASGANFCTECGAMVAPAPEPVTSATIRIAEATLPRQAQPIDVISPDASDPATLPTGNPVWMQHHIATLDDDIHGNPAFDPIAGEQLIRRILGMGVALLLPIGLIVLASGLDLAAVIIVTVLVMLVLSVFMSR